MEPSIPLREICWPMRDLGARLDEPGQRMSNSRIVVSHTFGHFGPLNLPGQLEACE